MFSQLGLVPCHEPLYNENSLNTLVHVNGYENPLLKTTDLTAGTSLVVQWLRLHAPNAGFDPLLKTTDLTAGTSLVVQWLRLHAPNAGFDPWPGT